MSTNQPKPTAPAKVAEPKAPSAPVAPSTPPSKVPPLFRGIDWWTLAVTTIVVFLGYWWTLAPDLTLEDCGELAVASMYAGVPHPPGYPVWTIYTWFWTLLPVSNIAYRVALSSAFAGALSCGLVALMVSRGSSMIMEGIADLKNIERKWENALCIVAGLVSGMLIGFNGFMWSQAVIVEVYTLSVLSMTLVMACLLRWIYAPHQRRYLYWALFWFGICFNNHQSLLVIALGIQVAVTAVSPKMGRNFWMWNVVFYLGGLMAKSSMLEENGPLKAIFHLVGFGSLVTYIVLLVKTKIRAVEFARDVLLVGSMGCIALTLLSIMNYTSMFEFKTGLFVLFILFSLCVLAGFFYLAKSTWKFGSEWLTTFIGGWAWALGVAFYLYMALASMSNPPLNWGYPRTVQGFIHAFTRGQYERIHPTTDVGRYFEQLLMYIGGALEEFNLVYVLIAFIPFLFFFKMQKRERAWMLGLFAIYLTLSLFLLVLLNPAPDRQARDLNRVFFTASHFMIAMGTGYGLTLIGGYLLTQYERWRNYVLFGALGSTALALFMVFVTYQSDPAKITFRSQLFDLVPSHSPSVRLTATFSLILAAGAAGLLLINRSKAPMVPLLALFAILPLRSAMSHWEDNEQRGHYFGYWFGHDMFRPPFKDPTTGKLSYDDKRRAELLKDPAHAKFTYPEMERDTVLYGGTDPGRFNPTYMIFCESFIPPSKRNFMDPNFDRRDVILITQNALADGTYLQYIRAHYNRSTQLDPPFFTDLARGPKEIEAGVETNIIARMLAPVDRFFLGLGDDIEKKRRAGSSFFENDHFADLAGLGNKLKAGADPLSKYITEKLSADTRTKLGGGDSSTASALANDLNKLLEAGPLFETNRFAGVKISDRTWRFIRENPQSHTRIRLNRILLEEAYPKEITKSLGGVYPDMEMKTASNEDSQRCFKEYLDDAQRRLDHDRRNPNAPRQIKPGEDVRIVDNRVTVSGQVAVMAINALLTKVMFEQNPDREFYVEESFPLDWMYPYLTPYGVIMKINREPLPELSQEIIDRDHAFWSEYSTRLIGNWITYDTSVSNICDFANRVYERKEKPTSFTGDWAFLRDGDAQKAFSKLRSSIAGVYNYRIGEAQRKGDAAEMQRMLREAEFAFKQAYAFCPYSPEALFRWVNLLLTTGRIDEALLIATTSQKLDPFNGQIENLIYELKRIKTQQGGAVMPPPNPAGGLSQLGVLEKQFQADPSNVQLAMQLASGYMQTQGHAQALGVLELILGNPKADGGSLIFAANIYAQLGQIAKVEQALAAFVKNDPENPEGQYDLAAVRAMQSKTAESIQALSLALAQSAKRLQKNPGAPNLYSNMMADARFGAVRSAPEFAKLMDTYKGK